MIKRKTKAQSVTEYAILIGVVIGAFAAMQTYFRRSMNAKIKQSADTMNSAGNNQNIELGDGFNISLGSAKGQYEPYYTESASNTFSESDTEDTIQDGKVSKTIHGEVSGQAAGSYRAEKLYDENANQ